MIFRTGRARGAGLFAVAAGIACSANNGSTPSGGIVTAADLNAVVAGNAALNQPFAAAPLNSLVALSGSIQAVFPSAPVPVAVRSELSRPALSVTPEEAVVRYLSRLVAARGRRPSLAVQSIRGQAATVPSNLLGKTFEWDANSSSYVDKGTAGAPADAVRFILYHLNANGTIDDVNLIEVAKLDMTDAGINGPAGSGSLNFSIFEGNVSYGTYTLNYTQDATLVSGGASGSVTSVGGAVTFDISPLEVANDSSHVRVNVSQFNVDLNHDGTAEHYFVQDGTETACTGQTIVDCSDFQVAFSQLKQPENVVYYFGGVVNQAGQNITGANISVTLGGQAVATITADNAGTVTIRDPQGNIVTSASNTGQFIAVLFIDASLVDQAGGVLLAPGYSVIPNGGLIHLPY